MTDEVRKVVKQISKDFQWLSLARGGATTLPNPDAPYFSGLIEAVAMAIVRERGEPPESIKPC